MHIYSWSCILKTVTMSPLFDVYEFPKTLQISKTIWEDLFSRLELPTFYLILAVDLGSWALSKRNTKINKRVGFLALSSYVPSWIINSKQIVKQIKQLWFFWEQTCLSVMCACKVSCRNDIHGALFEKKQNRCSKRTIL
jgi:hypothetical protein